MGGGISTNLDWFYASQRAVIGEITGKINVNTGTINNYINQARHEIGSFQGSITRDVFDLTKEVDGGFSKIDRNMNNYVNQARHEIGSFQNSVTRDVFNLTKKK